MIGKVVRPIVAPREALRQPVGEWQIADDGKDIAGELQSLPSPPLPLGYKTMKRSLSCFVALACLIAVPYAQAEVRLPKIFGDSMVLQQQSQVAVWGWADADEAVTVSLGDAKAEAKAGADGKWMTKLATPAAGGPIELKGKG